MEHGIYSLKHPDRTALRVGLSPYRGAELLAAIYPEMNRRFPDVEIVPVEGHSGDILKAVRGGEADLSFGAVEGSDRDLKMIPIHREEIVLCVPAFHKLAEFGSRDVTRAPRVRLEEFKDSPFVQIDGSAAVGQITERALRQAGFRPVVVFRSVNVQLVYRIICTGAGVGLIPWYAAVPNREVVYFRLENPVYMTGGVVFRKDHALTQAYRDIFPVFHEYEIFHMNRFYLISKLRQPFIPVCVLVNLRMFQHIGRIKYHPEAGTVHLIEDLRCCLQVFERVPVYRLNSHVDFQLFCLLHQTRDTVHHIRMPDLLFLICQMRICGLGSDNGRAEHFIEREAFLKCVYSFFSHIVIWISKIHVTAENVDLYPFSFEIRPDPFYDLRRYIIIGTDLRKSFRQHQLRGVNPFPF